MENKIMPGEKTKTELEPEEAGRVLGGAANPNGEYEITVDKSKLGPDQDFISIKKDSLSPENGLSDKTDHGLS